MYWPIQHQTFKSVNIQQQARLSKVSMTIDVNCTAQCFFLQEQLLTRPVGEHLQTETMEN